eukprot:10335661-Lingulodinium_polyedra.AAC.1
MAHGSPARPRANAAASAARGHRAPASAEGPIPVEELDDVDSFSDEELHTPSEHAAPASGS